MSQNFVFFLFLRQKRGSRQKLGWESEAKNQISRARSPEKPFSTWQPRKKHFLLWQPPKSDFP